MSYRLLEIGSEWDSAWDRLAGEAVESGFMQSSAWTVFRRSEGYRTVRYGLFESESLCGGGCLHYYPAEVAEGFWVCPEGPVLPWEEPESARAGLRLMIQAAHSHAREQGGLGLRIEPHLQTPRPSVLRNWTRAPIDLTPVHTLLLDLRQSDEMLRAQMSPKGRYNLGLSERHGVHVRMSQRLEDIRGFYRLFQETAARSAFFAEPYGFFLNLGAALFPGGHAALFLASWEGELLSAVLVVFFGRRATYLYGGSAGTNRHVMPNYAAHFAAIQEARARGCREYDLYGWDPFGLPDHPFAGFSRFKKQFGGQSASRIGAFDCLFYERIADRLIECLR